MILKRLFFLVYRQLFNEKKNMQKNKIALLICLLVYCGNVVGMLVEVEHEGGSYWYYESLVRQEGYWTTEQDLKMDDDDNKNKKFFYEVTRRDHQRESFYAVTPYIAEFYSTISNAGFLYVASKFMKDKPI